MTTRRTLPTLLTLEQRIDAAWMAAEQETVRLVQHAGPSLAQAATTALLTHFGLGGVAPEVGILAGTVARQVLDPTPMDPFMPDRPAGGYNQAVLAFAAPIDDPQCTPGYCLWFPVTDPGRVPTIHPDQVAAVLPLWLPSPEAVTRYAHAVLSCPVSLEPDPAAAAAATASWLTLPAADRAAPVFLPDTPWLLSALAPEGPWMPWRPYHVGGVPRVAVIPSDPGRLHADFWAVFHDAPALRATQADALALLHESHVVGSGDSVMVYPASELAPYFTASIPPQRRPGPEVPALSAAKWAWPPAAPDPPRRADGTHVWHVATLRNQHTTIAWTVDGLRAIRLGGRDPAHPWFFPSAAAAFGAFQTHGLLAVYGQPPIAAREIVRAYPELLRVPATATRPIPGLPTLPVE